MTPQQQPILPDRWYHFCPDSRPPSVQGPFTMAQLRAKNLPPTTQLCNFEARKYGTAADWNIASSRPSTAAASATPFAAPLQNPVAITASPAPNTTTAAGLRTTPALPNPSTMQSSPAAAASQAASKPPETTIALAAPAAIAAKKPPPQTESTVGAKPLVETAASLKPSPQVNNAAAKSTVTNNSVAVQSAPTGAVAAMPAAPYVFGGTFSGPPPYPYPYGTFNPSTTRPAAVETYKPPPPPSMLKVAPPPPVQNSMKPLASVTNKPASKKKTTKKNKQSSSFEYSKLLEDPPEPGYVDEHAMFYSTLNDDTLTIVADKLGIPDWKSIAEMKDNISRFGKVRGKDKFKPGTLLRIPKNYSKWKIQSLHDTAKEDMKKLETCEACHTKERPSDPNDPPMLLCDGCDAACHVGCAGLSQVPDGDWFCNTCLDVLQARRDNQTNPRYEPGTLRAVLPPLSKLAPEQVAEVSAVKEELRQFWRAKQAHVMEAIKDNFRILKESLPGRKAQLKDEIFAARQEVVYPEFRQKQAKQEAMECVGLVDFSDHNDNSGWIKAELRDGGTRVYRGWWGQARIWNDLCERRRRVLNDNEYLRWSRVYEQKTNRVNELMASLSELEREERDNSKSCEMELRKVAVEFASLLGQSQLSFEKQSAFQKREFVPRHLGSITVDFDEDVVALNMLREPEELIIAVPRDFSHSVASLDQLPELQVGETYAIFAREALFDKKRDDEMPIDANGLRDAQRRLFDMLTRNEEDKKMIIVSEPQIPPSVKPRGDDNTDATRFFDLSELVRDCNCDLDLPREPTPALMSKNGHELRDYQQSSLRWCLDKERENTGLGTAGELWHRARFLDSDAETGDYFFCELTGSFALDIFDFQSDAHQKDAARNFGGMPTGAVLGEEMGLGKTAISLALILANPAPKDHRVLPREHLWALDKKKGSDHPSYIAPPSTAGATSSSASTVFISSGTLVVVPMTLLSQWQTEVKKFAPHLSVLTLHNADNPTIQAVASSDIVIASTFLLQQTGRARGTASTGINVKMINFLRRIHWHRILTDESHLNQQGSTTKQVLASLSATHRFCITGTPLGGQLSDFYGQLRFLRIAPFHREQWWKNNVETPYHEHNPEALRILRSLLSRVVMRHSKEQTQENGRALLALPPRTVDTELIPFGSESEKAVYEAIEDRNRSRFMELKKESAKTVASKYMELNGMLVSARQACAHVSLIDFHKFHRLNQKLADEKLEAKGKKKRAPVKATTRAGVLEVAVERARHSAKSRMRGAIMQFQHGDCEMLECPVCLDPVGEAQIALPACAHPICTTCILSILDSASSSREPVGHCPTCRDIVRRSELTFLGDAAEAGTHDKKIEDEDANLDKKPAAVNVNGFRLKAQEVEVSVVGSTTLRAGHSTLSGDELKKQLRSDLAELSTLDEPFLKNVHSASGQVGTKVALLLQEIRSMMRKSATSKCIVFTQFLGVLDVAGNELEARNIGFVRLDGSCKQYERADALMTFDSDPSVRVFLLSMRSGAVGLNLTAADHCFIMDTAQNPAIEEQGIDRIHRIGQTKPVTVKRFVIQGTVEERLLSVRRKLGVDRSVGTQVNGVVQEDDDAESRRPRKKARTSSSEDEVMDAQQQKRVETLETLYGCKMKVHKA